MQRSIVTRRPPAALLLAATTVLGISATVAILRLTTTESRQLTLPIPPRAARSSVPSVSSTVALSSTSTSEELRTAGSAPAPVTAPVGRDVHYRWQRVPEVAELVGPGPDSGLSAVALVEGQGLIAVGNAGSTAVVLVSPDGRDWTRVEEAEPSLDGAVLRDIAVVEELLIAVGSRRGEPAAWASSDGVDWTPISVAVPVGGRALGLLDGVTLSQEGAVVAVGFATGTGGIWTLADGSFAPVEGLAPMAAGGQVLADVASTAVGLVAGGNDADGRPVIWRSADARTWTRSDPPADARGASVAAVSEVAGELVAVGYDAEGARMWTAGDDTQWLDVAAPPVPGGPPQALWAVAMGRNGGLAGGQRPGGPLCWASGDAAVWVDCYPANDLVAGTTRDLVAVPDGFIAVGSATDSGSVAGAAIWRVEVDNQAALPH